VMVEDRHGYAAQKLRERFAATISDVSERIVFLPLQTYPDYLSLLSAAEVVLDPLYYSGGTTSFEALSLGKPIVTLPWRFQVGRTVLACYRKMGIAGCVARDKEDYVRMSVALGTDADYRHSVEREICEARAALFEDLNETRECEEVLERLVDEARSG
jgi:protein O-GlcNAc transferase